MLSLPFSLARQTTTSEKLFIRKGWAIGSVQNPYKQCIADHLSPFLERRWCTKLSTAMFKGTELSNSDDVAIQMSIFNYHINIFFV